MIPRIGIRAGRKASLTLELFKGITNFANLREWAVFSKVGK
jgi:hypothetical protein